jgi:hypothetical protein
MEKSSNPLIECSICGRDGGPYDGCSRGCQGRARYAQSKQYTLSEIRSGRAPREDRYGSEGQLGPSTSDPLWAGTE